MRRGVIPPGKAGLLILAAALVPVALGKAKPWAKKFGEGLVKLGEKIQEGAQEAAAETEAKPAETPAAESQAKPAAAPKTARTRKTAAKPKPRTKAQSKPKPPAPRRKPAES